VQLSRIAVRASAPMVGEIYRFNALAPVNYLARRNTGFELFSRCRWSKLTRLRGAGLHLQNFAQRKIGSSFPQATTRCLGSTPTTLAT
jgi:hypothetical protein